LEEMMKSKLIREKFLNFFQKKGHTRKESASLIPQQDPSLLFTGAGMNQFKKEFFGQGDPNLKEAVTCQKCFRTSDIEEVGKTNRHHTFFEMLGNFSFGDYFKEGAITLAWEFIQKDFNLPEDRIWISIYKDDEEAHDLWREKIGVPESRIVRLGKEDNWWDMGTTGPCGPCSEIIIDRGEEFGCGKSSCGVDCGCDRYLELWNLVFTQFDRQEDGSLVPLPQQNIDTGMGLERAAMLLQNVAGNFLTDLIAPILNQVCEMGKVEYGSGDKQVDKSLRIICDHVRAVTFLISDGVFPTNEGRGYVLRRLIRKGMRQGDFLNIKVPFLYQLVPRVVEIMEDAYPDLKTRKEHVIQVLKSEEDSYKHTVEEGMKILEEMIAKVRKSKDSLLSGKDLFKLYDTYGFPVELAQEVTKEKGLSMDMKGFQKEMDSQKERGRLSWRQGEGEQFEGANIYLELGKRFGNTKFVGYDEEECSAKVRALIKFTGKSGEELEEASAGEKVEILTDQTPFYAEAGGQVGDKGIFKTKGAEGVIEDTYYQGEGLTVHLATIKKGKLSKGETIELSLDKVRRQDLQVHHTSTHLLQQALRQILGSHVQQTGSLVEENYFRFDFSHFAAIKKDQLKKIEVLINTYIREDLPVDIQNLKLEEAKKQGALSFFGEKYAETVRMVSIGPISKELCGGTHIKRTGEIGILQILSESSVGKGLRRIEAIAGRPAYEKINQDREVLEESANLLKVSPSSFYERLEKVSKEKKVLEKEVEVLKNKLMQGGVGGKSEEAKIIEGIRVIVSRRDRGKKEELRRMVDVLKSKNKENTLVVLGGVLENKVVLVVGLTKDLANKGLHAGKIVKEVASIVGGGGGGRPDMAEAGGKDVGRLDEALNKVPDIVKKLMVDGQK